VKANQATHPVGVMCRLLRIPRSGFYAWDDRPMSARRRTDLALTAKIEAIHRRSKGVYGSPMIHAELADDYGIRVGRKRVARLMRAAGLRGATLRRYVVTTLVNPASERAVDLVDRKFYTDGPDRLWVADITYIPTWAGFLYLAMVLDVYSRRIVGWAMETHLRTELILAALDMAITQRQPSAVIHHSDRGCQGEFQRSSQHLAIGGVAWDDQRVGLQIGQDVRRCDRRVGRASTSGMPSRRFGHALRWGLQVRTRLRRAACRSPLARAGSARPVGWRRSVWFRSQDGSCRSVSARSSR
jgi:putative transposase